jgi:coenzyme F420-dependent glucose-6-phosphate dehydrogenase
MASQEIEDARVYTLPDYRIPIMVASSAPLSAELAGRAGDGLITTSPDEEIRRGFEDAGGSAKPRIGQMAACWAETEAEGRRTAAEIWPNTALGGTLSHDIRLPADFQAAVKTVREEDVVDHIPCGPDPEVHRRTVQLYVDAGYDHIYVHQIGPNQEQFLRFYEREVLPKFPDPARLIRSE